MALANLAGVRKVPDERYLAFAVCIVHSKPEQLSIQEYIRLLRQHVANGRRENALSSVHRHLDKSSYWRSEYERLQDALTGAERERIDLKLEVDRLKAAADNKKLGNPTKKRKKQEDEEDIVPVPRSPKKAKVGPNQKAATLTPFNPDADVSFSHRGEPGDTLMRSFYRAHALLKSHNRTEPALLAHHLVHAANAVTGVLEQGAKQYCTDKILELDSLKAVLTAAGRSMQSLLVGYARVSNAPDGELVLGHIIYAYVQVFEKCTIIIRDIAKAEVERSHSECAVQETRPSTSIGKAKQTRESTTKQQKNTRLSVFCGFIISSIDLLDAKKDSHKALFEALAYVLIEKVAASLYTLVFGCSRGATLEKEIAVGAQQEELEGSSQALLTKPDEMEVELAKLEAPHLIQILTCLMQAAPAHFDAAETSKGGKAKVTSKAKGRGTASSSKDNLAILAKDRLQGTLIHCMFGTEGFDAQDLYVDCLRKPALSGSLPAVPHVEQVDVRDWFKEEVWRLLGWDILSREGGR